MKNIEHQSDAESKNFENEAVALRARYDEINALLQEKKVSGKKQLTQEQDEIRSRLRDLLYNKQEEFLDAPGKHLSVRHVAGKEFGDVQTLANHFRDNFLSYFRFAEDFLRPNWDISNMELSGETERRYNDWLDGRMFSLLKGSYRAFGYAHDIIPEATEKDSPIHNWLKKLYKRFQDDGLPVEAFAAGKIAHLLNEDEYRKIFILALEKMGRNSYELLDIAHQCAEEGGLYPGDDQDVEGLLKELRDTELRMRPHMEKSDPMDEPHDIAKWDIRHGNGEFAALFYRRKEIIEMLLSTVDPEN